MSTEQRRYEWGDKVWLTDDDGERLRGIVIECDKDSVGHYLVSVQYPDRPLSENADWHKASRLSPRDDDKSKTWRLPEPGDTVRVVSQDDPYYGVTSRVSATNWGACSPVGLETGGVYDVADVELVRLHDEPAADHIVDANKMVEPTTMSRIDRVVVVSKPESPHHGLIGKVIRESMDGEHCQVMFMTGVFTALKTDECELLPEHAVKHFDDMRKLIRDPETWDVSGKLTPLSEIRARREQAEDPIHDPVKKARHYNVHPSGVECITIAKHMNFCLGSVLKYIWRVDDKEVPIQDLRKAIQFLEYEIERRLEKEDQTSGY